MFFSRRKFSLIRGLSLALLVLSSVYCFAAKDVKGSKDHPMVSRYPGSNIIVYRAKDYDEYTLPTGPAALTKGKAGLTTSKDIEGKVTRIAYVMPKGTSTLKIYRNFEKAFKAAGFTEAFSCKKKACGISSGWQKHFLQSQVWGKEESQRMFTGTLNKNNKTIYVIFYVGDQGNRITAELDVIETKRMQNDLIKVDPKKLGAAIETEGKVAVYGIHFDTDKSEVKPNSKPALEAIAALLKMRPKLKLYVVGHTDDEGKLQHNMQLSGARAKSVVSVLVKRYNINAQRLLAYGAGPYAPVAPNTSEQGKAKNRRVELVKRLK